MYEAQNSTKLDGRDGLAERVHTMNFDEDNFGVTNGEDDADTSTLLRDDASEGIASYPTNVSWNISGYRCLCDADVPL